MATAKSALRHRHLCAVENQFHAVGPGIVPDLVDLGLNRVRLIGTGRSKGREKCVERLSKVTLRVLAGRSTGACTEHEDQCYERGAHFWGLPG